jgi:hypothetical protein
LLIVKVPGAAEGDRHAIIASDNIGGVNLARPDLK